MLIGGKTLIQHRNHARASSRTIQPQNTPVRGKLKASMPCCQSENMKMSLRTISDFSSKNLINIHRTYILEN